MIILAVCGDEWHEAANAAVGCVCHSQLGRPSSTILSEDKHIAVLSESLHTAQRISDDGEMLLLGGE